MRPVRPRLVVRRGFGTVRALRRGTFGRGYPDRGRAALAPGLGDGFFRRLERHAGERKALEHLDVVNQAVGKAGEPLHDLGDILGPRAVLLADTDVQPCLGRRIDRNVADFAVAPGVEVPGIRRGGERRDGVAGVKVLEQLVCERVERGDVRIRRLAHGGVSPGHPRPRTIHPHRSHQTSPRRRLYQVPGCRGRLPKP